MASIQARHTRACALSKPWTTFEQARRGCTCATGPTYYVVVRRGRRLHRERVGRDRQQAERALRKIGTQVDDGEYRPQANIRFAEWGQQWLVALRRPKESTRFSYGSTIAHATEVFGDRVVRSLSAGDVSAFLERLAELGLSPSTQAKHLRVLGACLQAAVRHGYAARNSVRELDRSEKPSLERRESAYFETDELPGLFAEMDHGLHRTVCLVALKTGMRQCELVALLWRDVDLHESVIRVRRTLAVRRLPLAAESLVERLSALKRGTTAGRRSGARRALQSASATSGQRGAGFAGRLPFQQVKGERATRLRLANRPSRNRRSTEGCGTLPSRHVHPWYRHSPGRLDPSFEGFLWRSGDRRSDAAHTRDRGAGPDAAGSGPHQGRGLRPRAAPRLIVPAATVASNLRAGTAQIQRSSAHAGSSLNTSSSSCSASSRVVKVLTGPAVR